MPEPLGRTYQPFLEAISYAARAHLGQTRKDKQTPYISHVFRVCMILRHVFEIDDQRVLMAAVFHDIIEDTTTDFDDLEIRFDAEIARWVAALSKDKRQVYEDREQAYEESLATGPWQVQVVKLADIFDNLIDMGYLRPENQSDALKNKKRYLEAIASDLKPEAAKAWEITSNLYQEYDEKAKAR